MQLKPATITLIVSIFLASLQAATAEQPPEKDKQANENKASEDIFLRVKRDRRGDPIAMDTSTVRFEATDGSGVVVDLIGAVHVGDAEYYSKLNQQFAKYEALLYELVAPEGTVIPKGGGGGSRHPIGSMQQGMKSMLELAYQLEEVDYTKPNFVHADMSPEEFAKSMEDRGESFLQMMFRMMGQAMAVQAKEPAGSSDAKILMALFSRDRSLQLKRIMSEQFEDLEASMSILQGPDGSTLITERNRKAFEVLKKEIKAGKKKIGVFYGAGHLPDMAKRLEKDFKLQRTSVNWVTAWNMSGTKSNKSNSKPRAPKKTRLAQ